MKELQTKVWEVQLETYDELKQAVERAIEALGEFDRILRRCRRMERRAKRHALSRKRIWATRRRYRPLGREEGL